MSNYVPGEGPSNAQLMIIGEAPGAEEDRLQRPFVGPSGEIVDQLLQQNGTDRRSVYVTNVVKHRPPNNDIKRSLQPIDHYLPQLVQEIQEIKPNAILAFGNTALEVLCGLKGIEKYRGSILPCSLATTKVIATIHPAALLRANSDSKLRSWKDLTYIKWDVKRAIEQSKFKEYNIPRRNLFVCRNALDLYRFLDRNEGRPFVSVDIETFRTFPICIGLAFSSSEAISIPLFNFASTVNPLGISRSDMIQIWKLVADLLANPEVMKIGQNFKFDESLLETCYNSTVHFGLKVYGFFFDTMLAFRTLYPELSGKLEFIASVLTEEPYWKDEGREYNPKKDKFDRLLLYNAKDAAVTYECFERCLEELQQRKIEDFFFTKVMPLHPFYSRIEKRGILRDSFAKNFLSEKYKDQQLDLQGELNTLTETYTPDPVNVQSNGKNGDIPLLLYRLMKLPQRKGTGEKEISALLRNSVKDPQKKRILELILQIRKVRKTRGTYIDAEVDHRGRLLTSYRIMLSTGRTSTSILKPPVTTVKMGLAFQTITKHGEDSDAGADLRTMMIPDPGYIFIEPDLSQAEARVVAVLARDEKLLKMFEYEVDIHRVTAGWIEGNCPDDLLNEFFNAGAIASLDLAKRINEILKKKITQNSRQIGKMFRHAGHLGVGKRTAGENAGTSEWRAGQILTQFHATNPKIKSVFHAGIIDALQHNQRTLISPHGRRRQFLDKWGEELFKEAYAQIPQATVSDHLKFAAQRIEKRAPYLQILQESHDSFLGQVPIGMEDKLIPIIQEELETPIDFTLCTLPTDVKSLIIPCEIGIGKANWKEMVKVA